jgi:hypothetical protein
VGDYWQWTRDVGVSWAYLLPLLAAYEIGVLWVGSGQRNAAEMMFKEPVEFLPGWASWVQHLILVAVVILAVDLVRRDVPVLRLYPMFLMEATLLALLLGPAIGMLLETVGLRPAASGADTPQQLLLSLGAGIYEEIVFRFLALAGVYTFLHRVGNCPRLPSFLVALLFSAALFALYHHLGSSAEPLRLTAVLFRFLAGILLGVVLAARGLALCVYLHAFYDVLCDLKGAGLLS